jgi:hypothetical protein
MRTRRNETIAGLIVFGYLILVTARPSIDGGNKKGTLPVFYQQTARRPAAN